MAVPNTERPNRIYRGTVDEVFSHRGEIPDGATVELKVFAEGSETGTAHELGAFGGKSLIEAFPDLYGTEHGGPADVAEHPEKYLIRFGETGDPRNLDE